ncbi:hypothetical protein RF11_12453 [Thelohanellus kitauei]|uniref:ISXO2-like transposase domain-containing protein n=1 Tax=Thelohanellus kitauei TaxID=669202 RepID=A0A0C2N255_THEKT|nr:hypothetical protein RF11_12453 [Thelohanellus kitauei]
MNVYINRMIDNNERIGDHMYIPIDEGLITQRKYGIIFQNVELGSTIHANGWEAYGGIERYNYLHEVMIHERQYISDSGGSCKTLLKSITNKRRDLVFSDLAEYGFREKHGDQLMTETLN